MAFCVFDMLLMCSSRRSCRKTFQSCTVVSAVNMAQNVSFTSVICLDSVTLDSKQRRGILTELSLCYSIVYVIIVVHSGTSSSYRSVDWLGL